MKNFLQHHVHARTDRRRVVRRRDFLRTVAAGSLATGAVSWTDTITLSAEELRDRGMACILLWMQGGPSQFETFDPKPDHENGGEFAEIQTSAAGLRISEHLPQLAKHGDQLAALVPERAPAHGLRANGRAGDLGASQGPKRSAPSTFLARCRSRSLYSVSSLPKRSRKPVTPAHSIRRATVAVPADSKTPPGAMLPQEWPQPHGYVAFL